MHRLSWIRPSVLALVLGVVLAAPAGAAMPDAWIATKAKLALMTTSGVSGMAINVDTVFGRVTLEARAAAEADARTVSGVQAPPAFQDITVEVQNSKVKNA